jgi:hypothetical protein
VLKISNIDLVKGKSVGTNFKVSKVKEQYNVSLDSDCYVLMLRPTTPTVRNNKLKSAAIIIARYPNESGRYSVAICWNTYTNILYDEEMELSHLTESVVFGMAKIVLNKKINSL